MAAITGQSGHQTTIVLRLSVAADCCEPTAAGGFVVGGFSTAVMINLL
jgi:hypothetical protein